jgi:hypothetical protein
MENQTYIVDEAVLNDPSNSDGLGALDYYLNSCAYLLNVLQEDSKLQDSELADLLGQVFRFLRFEPSKRDTERAEEVVRQMGLFGVVGKALWFLRNKKDAQRHRELTRLATEPKQIIGNQYLFYIAGTLASVGYDVEFVPEKGNQALKTPDLRVSKAGKVTWIEANAKAPVKPVDSTQGLARMIRDIVAEKKLKFAKPEYMSGMIVADISPADYLANESGRPPGLSLNPVLIEHLPGGSKLYRLYRDFEWNRRPENNGNVIAYIIDELKNIDDARYGVNQCLLTVTRRAWLSDGVFSFPKYHLLVVDRSAEDQILGELARLVYVI